MAAGEIATLEKKATIGYTLCAMVMLTACKQFKTKRIHPQITLAYPRLRLIFVDGALDLIKVSKGLRNDADVAWALGISRAYMSLLRSSQRSANDEVICRVAYLMNNFDRWHIYFCIANCGDPVPQNHQINNMVKYYGVKPYTRFSSAAIEKKRDYEVEQK